jgi:acyl-coenzyme A synthetase/AMP-(fatty) acid ligase
VVPRDGCDPQESELLAFCAEHLAAYKRPRAVVRLDHLPRNANGKLMRAALP